MNERTSSISRYDVQWLCEVAPSFVYQVTPHLQYTNTQKHNQCVRLPIKRLVQYHTGTCTNLNKTHFLQKMMFFAIITSNTDLGTRVFVKIHAIHVPLIIWYHNLLSIYHYGNAVFIITHTFLGGGRGWWLKGVIGVGN